MVYNWRLMYLFQLLLFSILRISIFRSAPVLMKECLTAIFFLRVLQTSGYFSKEQNKNIFLINCLLFLTLPLILGMGRILDFYRIKDRPDIQLLCSRIFGIWKSWFFCFISERYIWVYQISIKNLGVSL